MNISERILGIDIIRIVSMLMILVLHICLQGGILDALTVGSAAYGAAWLLESFCYCAVNCYALITGYVMYSAERKNFKYSRIIPLWLQVFVWSVLIVILFKVFGHAELTVKDVISAVFPILNSRYWYFTAYFGMFFLIPFFNILIDNIDKKGYICLIATLFSVFSFLPFVIMEDPFITKFGYSTLWLTVLYFAGAFIRRTEQEITVKKRVWTVIYILSSVISFISSMLPQLIIGESVDTGGSTYAYSSPFTVASAVSLFMLLKDIRIKNRFVTRAVEKAAAVSFGVYLIHVDPLVFNCIFKGMFSGLTELPCFIMIIDIIAYSVLLYAVLGTADYIRLFIFGKLKVKERSEQLVTGAIKNLKAMKIK